MIASKEWSLQGSSCKLNRLNRIFTEADYIRLEYCRNPDKSIFVIFWIPPIPQILFRRLGDFMDYNFPDDSFNINLCFKTLYLFFGVIYVLRLHLYYKTKAVFPYVHPCHPSIILVFKRYELWSLPITDSSRSHLMTWLRVFAADHTWKRNVFDPNLVKLVAQLTTQFGENYWF